MPETLKNVLLKSVGISHSILTQILYWLLQIILNILFSYEMDNLLFVLIIISRKTQFIWTHSQLRKKCRNLLIRIRIFVVFLLNSFDEKGN